MNEVPLYLRASREEGGAPVAVCARGTTSGLLEPSVKKLRGKNTYGIVNMITA